MGYKVTKEEVYIVGALVVVAVLYFARNRLMQNAAAAVNKLANLSFGAFSASTSDVTIVDDTPIAKRDTVDNFVSLGEAALNALSLGYTGKTSKDYEMLKTSGLAPLPMTAAPVKVTKAKLENYQTLTTGGFDAIPLPQKGASKTP